MNNDLKRNVLFACFLLGPLLQLIGDSLWVTGAEPFAWSLGRQLSYIFFIPAGILIAKMVEKQSLKWAIVGCGLFMAGCMGNVAMMPLIRLGAYYPMTANHEFPVIVESVLDKGWFAAALFPFGLCFPLGFLSFGIGFLRKKKAGSLLGIGFMQAGVLFFAGNALEINIALIAGDIFILILFLYVFRLLNSKREKYNRTIETKAYQPV